MLSKDQVPHTACAYPAVHDLSPTSTHAHVFSCITQITLVDRAERFVFKPLLYELLNGAADEAEVAPPLQQLLAPYPVRFVQVSG